MMGQGDIDQQVRVHKMEGALSEENAGEDHPFYHQNI